ncbi:hypothetical protein KKG31_05175, partial [Patescibacteria group bacterium]|nr:hypothetical protein [Patescibacteria group bacterium]MBU1758515.1 hypothetical protein [Patescibacteria group bacterium]
IIKFIIQNYKMPNLEEINKKTEELNKGEHGEIKIPDIIKSYYNKVNAVAKDFFDKYPQYPTTDVLKASDYFEIDRQMDVFAELYTEGMGMWSGERYASEICGVDKYIAKYDVIRAQYMT